MERRTKTDEQMIAELEQATNGLLFMSESDYPFEIICWNNLNEVTPEHLRSVNGQSVDTVVKVESLDEFFRAAASEPDWKGKEDRIIAKRYQELVRLLKANLTDVQVYKVGEINIPVYIIGQSSSGALIGLSTCVVET